MRKTVLILAYFALFVSNVKAQIILIDKISLPATGEDFGFYANMDMKEGVNIFYDLQTPNPQQRAQANLSITEVGTLVADLQKAAQIYVKWSQIAKEKGCRNLSKRIPVTFADQNIFFTQESKWYSEKGVDMQTLFLVDADGNCQLILQSDYMTSQELVAESSSLSFASTLIPRGSVAISGANAQITVGRYCSGSSLTFNSIDEINEFIKKLRNTVKWKRNNIESGKLFN